MTDRPISRREALAGAAALGVAAVGNPVPQDAPAPAAPEDPTKVPGIRPSVRGDRSPFEQPVRMVSGSAGGSSRTPLQDLHGIVTPSDVHFERHHHGIPVIDPSRYSLLIHGMVERPMMFTLDDLKRFPSTSRLYFVECAGNGGSGYVGTPRPNQTPQQIDGLMSTSEWIGVTLATLFREVGVHPDATWFLAEGMDAAVMTRSVPVDKGWDDAMIAYGQNGEAIRPAQGYPARLLLPGWEGNASVKWLRRIELSDRPFMTREETAKYSDPLRNGTARLFSFVLDAKSIITTPSYPQTLDAPGWREIRGVAWSGHGRITRVEVSLDGGRTWADAVLQDPVLPKCHTRFRFGWDWDGRAAHLMSRATDETGYVQPPLADLHALRGPTTHYHYNNIRGWRVDANGTVTYAPDA